MASNDSNSTLSPWPHRFAVLLCVTTFPLLFVGALVTTYGAGLAVPDWPTTYGYNMFLYPLAWWLAAPWNVFVEHGHRLFASLVGMFTIALLVSLWLRERRTWVIQLGAVALVLVIVQGVLGGLRVTEQSATMAQIHGCVGPLFFALTVAMCVLTSRLWQQAERPPESTPHAPREGSITRSVMSTIAARRIRVLALLTTFLAYTQLVVGSQLRHVQAVDSTESFRTAVWFHLVLAAAVLVHAVLLLIRIVRLPEKVAPLRRPAAALAVLVMGQIALGGFTWLLKYGWPSALPGPQTLVAGWTNTAGTFVQSVVITAHVAVGSLIVGAALMITLRSLRLFGDCPVGAINSASVSKPEMPARNPSQALAEPVAHGKGARASLRVRAQTEGCGRVAFIPVGVAR